MARLRFESVRDGSVPVAVAPAPDESAHPAAPADGLEHAAAPRRRTGARHLETSAVPPPRAKGRGEWAAYRAHASVWYLRRLIPNSIPRDAATVTQFLVARGLVAQDGGVPFAMSATALIRHDIEWEFWWMSRRQVHAIAHGLSSRHNLAAMAATPGAAAGPGLASISSLIAASL